MKTIEILNAVDFGSALRQARKRQDLTIHDLALASGVSPAWLSEVERGKDNARIGQLLHIANVLGLKVQIG